jgi:hypothetical protein
VVIATGVTYRRLGIPGLDPLRGHWGLLWGRRRRSARTRWPRGIRHRRSELRRPGCIAPSEVASRVTLLIRGLSLAAGMSDYLVRQLQETPNLDVRLGTRAGRDIPQSVRPGPRAPLPSRQVCLACSPPGTSGTGRSNVSPVPLAKGRSPWARSTGIWPRQETHSASSQHIGMPGEYDERRGAARAAAHVDRFP